jgi:transmembrane sensor
VILGQRGQLLLSPSSRSRRLRIVLRIFFALQHCLCAALGLCVRVLRTSRKRPDEMPFALALTLELTWLSPEQRQELQALGPPQTADPLRRNNVIDFSSYHPDRSLLGRCVPPAVPTQPRRHWPGACLVASAFMLGGSLLLQWPGDASSEYLTGTGERRNIPLADGSAVIMNTQSHLRVRFSAHGRDVELLSGEALFLVASNPPRPFRVHAQQTIVQALGTQFSVYLDRGRTRVAVAEGRVEVFANSGQGAIMLNPYGFAWADAGPQAPQVAVSAGHEAWILRNDKVTAAFEVASRTLPADELKRRMAWVNGQLAFSGEKLADVVQEFNRYNWRKLRIGDPEIAGMQVGGRFRSTNVDELVSVLTRLFGIRVVASVDPRSHEQVLELKRNVTGPP